MANLWKKIFKIRHPMILRHPAVVRLRMGWRRFVVFLQCRENVKFRESLPFQSYSLAQRVCVYTYVSTHNTAGWGPGQICYYNKMDWIFKRALYSIKQALCSIKRALQAGALFRKRPNSIQSNSILYLSSLPFSHAAHKLSFRHFQND